MRYMRTTAPPGGGLSGLTAAAAGLRFVCFAISLRSKARMQERERLGVWLQSRCGPIKSVGRLEPAHEIASQAIEFALVGNCSGRAHHALDLCALGVDQKSAARAVLEIGLRILPGIGDCILLNLRFRIEVTNARLCHDDHKVLFRPS